MEATDKPLADPTAMGLIGLAIGCAALTPVAFGLSLTPAALKTAGVLCILFSGGCQFLAGIGSFINHNVFGGTLLTTFSFNWFMNGWMLFALTNGTVPDQGVLLAVDICFLVVFVVMTWGFGYFSSIFLAFLGVIDLLYVLKIVTGVTGTGVLAIPIAACTIAIALIALWIAFGLLINPVAGRMVFRFPGPLFRPKG